MAQMKNGRFYISPKERLLKELDRAYEENRGFVIMTSLEGIEGEEYTINGPDMLPIKRIQYDNSFDDELYQKNEKRVRITRYSSIVFEPEMIPGGEE